LKVSRSWFYYPQLFGVINLLQHHD